MADNSNFHVNASGGIAWYPRDSESFEKLQHYADYAIELKQVIKLKVDYLQGFLLAKPQYLPPRIQEDVIKLIQLLNEK